ncbi:hypothetical protein [Myceligenerans pegani]|uniref:Uncharacterized protein n=1 Tax=Myceligenerans pegani TaxID=2776917 RepID=A0ABR9N2T1_9MICO|nr:hypothetical protein [Myceligenerans sp. TRM 65318]MBE1877949.1 hypothetical protein [Myceligenerans sp. TRM 65318]MBE3020220.1 hypothetical protein [Myceligenerans sp. TRM 65318]
MDAATRMQSIVSAAERSRTRRPERDPEPGGQDRRSAGDALTCDPQDRKRRANAALLDLVVETAAKRGI